MRDERRRVRHLTKKAERERMMKILTQQEGATVGRLQGLPDSGPKRQ